MSLRSEEHAVAHDLIESLNANPQDPAFNIVEGATVTLVYKFELTAGQVQAIAGGIVSQREREKECHRWLSNWFAPAWHKRAAEASEYLELIGRDRA